MSSEFTFLDDLSFVALKQLAQLVSSSNSDSFSTHTIQQIVGKENGAEIAVNLRELAVSGWSNTQIATVLKVMSDCRSTPSASPFDLVISGPDVAGMPTRSTHAVMHSLIAEAEKEVLLVGYVIHKATALLEPLAIKMKSNPLLNVWCCLDIGRGKDDTRTASQLVERFKSEFVERLWPWEPRPRVFYDPRSLAPWGSQRSSLHAKCIVVDRKASFVTSANFTDAAQHRNIEAGVLVRDIDFSSRLFAYFDGLRESHQITEL